jgi:hypothetical protein
MFPPGFTEYEGFASSPRMLRLRNRLLVSLRRLVLFQQKPVIAKAGVHPAETCHCEAVLFRRSNLHAGNEFSDRFLSSLPSIGFCYLP